jgi:hypothetical protein
MKCEVQWIDPQGAPTPDENEAVGMAQCFENDHALGRPLAICQAHIEQWRARAPSGVRYSWPGTGHEVKTEWKIIRFKEG